MRAILAIDQGTTGTTAMLVDERLRVLAETTVEFPQHFPKPGWVEHDPEEIWESVLKAIAIVRRKAKTAEIAAIGITNQRETVCFWDRKTGKTLGDAIVWQDRRTAGECERLKQAGKEAWFSRRTGLLLDPYFSGTKVAWALQHVAAVKAAAKRGTLAVGTIDSYLLWRLTGKAVHATEPSNASRTLCFDLRTLRFEPLLCRALGVPTGIWPDVRPSAGMFGKTQGVRGLPDGIPITGVLGDQQAALLGQACIAPGMAKCTYGTGAFLLLNTGERIVHSRHRLLTTVAWSIGGETCYALEGSAFIAGAAVQWLRDGLRIIKRAKDVEAVARSVPDSHGVTVVPAFAGLGAPHWNPHATAMITGITRGTTSAHIARATLEGIALQNTEILEAMHKDLGKPLTSLAVDGGASANNLLMQMQADVLGLPLHRPHYLQTTAFGAVFAAGLGAGIWKTMDAIRTAWAPERVFWPEITGKERSKKLAAWRVAVSKVLCST